METKIHIQFFSFFPDPTSIKPELDFGVIDGLCDVVDVLVGLIVVLLHRGRQRLKGPKIKSKCRLKIFFCNLYLLGFQLRCMDRKVENMQGIAKRCYLFGFIIMTFARAPFSWGLWYGY